MIWSISPTTQLSLRKKRRKENMQWTRFDDRFFVLAHD
jgi:hypothetical protein